MTMPPTSKEEGTAVNDAGGRNRALQPTPPCWGPGPPSYQVTKSRIVRMPPLESCPALMRKDCFAAIGLRARRLVRARCRPVVAATEPSIIPVPEGAATKAPLTSGSTHVVAWAIGGAIGVVGALVYSRRMAPPAASARSHV